MDLLHCWHNFSTKLSGSADTCWHFIYLMLKRNQSKWAKCLMYFLQCFGLIILGVHYLKDNREKERSDRTFPGHGGKPVNSHWVKISRMWRADYSVHIAFQPWASNLWPWAKPLTSLSSSQREWSSNLPSRVHLDLWGLQWHFLLT